MVFLRGLAPIREDLPAGPIREAQYAFDAGVGRLCAIKYCLIDEPPGESRARCKTDAVISTERRCSNSSGTVADGSKKTRLGSKKMAELKKSGWPIDRVDGVLVG